MGLRLCLFRRFTTSIVPAFQSSSLVRNTSTSMICSISPDSIQDDLSRRTARSSLYISSCRKQRHVGTFSASYIFDRLDSHTHCYSWNSVTRVISLFHATTLSYRHSLAWPREFPSVKRDNHSVPQRPCLFGIRLPLEFMLLEAIETSLPANYSKTFVV